MDERRRKGWVDYVLRNYVEHRPDLWENPVRALAHNYEILAPEVRDGFLLILISLSHETRLAWDSVFRIAREHLRQGDSPPAELQDWLAEVLSGRQPRPRTGTQALGARDLLICLAVYDLRQRFRISATRNDTSDEESGCDIAAHAFELRYEEVEGIWSGRDPLFF